MGINKRLVAVATLLFSLLSGGCAQHVMRDVAATGMVGFSNDYASPWFLASEDTDVMCGMGEGLSAMTYPMGPNVDALVPMLSLASGMCADERSKEAELLYIRAMRRNDIEAAQDARTMQKRWLALAAKRQYFGYQAGVRAWGEPGGACPVLADRNDQMSYLMGLLLGVQAFQSDFAVGGAAGVPSDVVAKVMSGITCLESDDFWGLPDAVSSMMDIMLAGAGGDDVALEIGYAKIARASAVGERQGVRMVQALEVTLYLMQGKADRAKQTIRDHVASKIEVPANPEYKLMDEMATRTILLLSDKMWTEATGQRTPYGKLGKFWDDKVSLEGALDIDDLL